MHFGFALELSDIDLWNIDLSDTHLDLLDTDIPSIFFVSIMSTRRLQDMSSRNLQDMSSRRLERLKIVMLKACWRSLQDRPRNVCWVYFFVSLPNIFVTYSLVLMFILNSILCCLPVSNQFCFSSFPLLYYTEHCSLICTTLFHLCHHFFLLLFFFGLYTYVYFFI